MLKQLNSFRFKAFVGSVLLALAFWILSDGSRIQTVDAATILAQAYRIDLATLNAEQILHYRTTLYQRTNPNAKEPPDPYHLPVLHLYSDTSETEFWIRGGNIPQNRVTSRDLRSRQLLSDSVRDGNRFGFFEADSGYAFVLPNSPVPPANQTTLPFPDSARQKGLEVVGTISSPWNRPAWLVRARATPPSAEEISRSSFAPLQRQKPFLKDLNISSFEYTWMVDQGSRRLVKYEAQVLTPSERVMVERLENSPFEVLSFNTLPANWLVFPPDNVPVIEGIQSPTSVIPPSSISLEKAITGADFAVSLPDISKLDVANTYVLFKSSVEPREIWQRNWRFDIQDASTHGLALEVTFSSKPAGSGYAITLIQGPSQRLVPLMRETPPKWAESRLVPIVLDGQQVMAWVASGGVFDSPPRRVVVMLEARNTFLFIVGQNHSEDQVLELVRNLRLIK